MYLNFELNILKYICKYINLNVYVKRLNVFFRTLNIFNMKSKELQLHFKRLNYFNTLKAYFEFLKVV